MIYCNIRVIFAIQSSLLKLILNILILGIFLSPCLLSAQDIPVTPAADTVALKLTPLQRYDTTVAHLFKDLRFMNFTGKPVARQMLLKKSPAKDHFFYLVAVMVLFLGCIRFFYSRYFGNLFRIFFNTSLRQSQLTDQLLQAKLPSLLFNTFFIISAGFFAFFALLQFNLVKNGIEWWKLLPACVIIVALIYIGKFFTLKFTGWITSYKDAADSYIFITFLINKILGVLLVPVVVILAFSGSGLSSVIIYPALMVVALLLLLRFFRSYGVLKGRLKVSRFHFLLYIAGVEIIPILLICKGLMIYLNKMA